jgi:hypothetical protein
LTKQSSLEGKKAYLRKDVMLAKKKDHNIADCLKEEVSTINKKMELLLYYQVYEFYVSMTQYNLKDKISAYPRT